MIEESSEPSCLVRAYQCAMAAIRGVRTIVIGIVVLLAGFADQFDLVDLLTTLKTLFGESARLGSILVAVAAIFIVLRLVTKGPAGFRKKNDPSDDGDTG